ncbi:4-(cytidine 5'-diphospho)-2-C-methyl-D-erythritol kinase [Gluconobacter sp. Dm-74]|uniref:4-(cytidine 5'-diphospho)-2-C-methyl-D-erythritol kinase n=1 Tax=Gluconobacter sp. Dm-74 TaxID=2799803 RepID=UPI001B8D07CB|nr:4-(cytidine 5'-diphospho)-2-C-methyl-D-erythritol kinase [Gluconobacter sp. Dm-74]MBS1090103.1 4-(cytidine 5'-diphospho)-2-C-methyl-D-erythritol kinase [Gluconobacter sp. Dm-74]
MTFPDAPQATAHAKINLFLHITGRRDDGYHLLDSLAVFAGAADRITLEGPADMMSLTIDGPFGQGLEADDQNLVLRAARALQAKAGTAFNGLTESFRLKLEKNLPVSSGIGGGSADAAATLRLLAREWNADQATLFPIAEKLGADVPVCIAQRPARMQGIGEILAPAPVLPDAGLLLVNPGVGVSTPEVFRAFAAGGGITERPQAFLPTRWDSAEAMVADLNATTNDLQAPALSQCPVIGTVLASIGSLPECLLARMSGSGATCFGIFPNPDSAKDAARILNEQSARLNWWTWAGGFHHTGSST